MIGLEDRQALARDIDVAHTAGARLKPACEIADYEWAEGFAPRFGLIEVDYATQGRKVRGSARKFEEIIRSGRLNFQEEA